MSNRSRSGNPSHVSSRLQFQQNGLSQVDFLTVEIEHVDVDALQAASVQFKRDVEPTPRTLSLIQVFHVTQDLHHHHHHEVHLESLGPTRGQQAINS